MKRVIFVIIFIGFISIAPPNYAQSMTAASIVQQQLDAYNTRDINGFISLFSEKAQLINFSDNKILASGKQKVHEVYAKLFDQSPKLHSKLINRIILGNTVIDHEEITGRMGTNETIYLVVIYEVEDNKIIKATIVR